MFKLSRHKSDRLGERTEFKFSSFQAFKVPKGWDRLQLTIILIETGKPIAKPIRTSVRSGTCQWTETLSESFLIPQNDASRELEECLIKIVVSLGSHRSGALGEVTLNLTEYISSQDSGLLPLPLQKCDQGTILQVRIQCLTPKSRSRDERSPKQISGLDSPHANTEDTDRSDVSDNMFNRSAAASSSSKELTATYPDEPVHRDASFSASGSHRSSDSGDSSVGRLNFSPRNVTNGGTYVGRQDSSGSHHSVGDDLPRSTPSSFNSRASGASTPHRWQDATPRAPSLRPPTSPKDFIEAAEDTIEELQDEAKMWERHAQKLKIDIQKLKKESMEKSKNQAELDMELQAACSERDSLKQEVLQLKSLLEENATKHTANEVGKMESLLQVQKELEEELNFQKESNANLSVQLKKTQEANMEFIAIIEELEETIEKQKPGIVNDLRESPVSETELTEEIKGLRAKVQELERDCAELTEENIELMYKMKVSGQDTTSKERDYNDAGSDSLRSQICDLEDELRRKDIIKEGMSETLNFQIMDLEKKCADLDTKLSESQANVEKKTLELSEVQRKFRDLEFAEGQERASKSEEVAILNDTIEEFEELITDVRREKSELEENLASVVQELEEKHQLVDSHISDNKTLQKKITELEAYTHVSEAHISEIEEVNLQLSERISGLEAQLRHLTDVKESTRLELEDSRSLVMEHMNEVAELKQKLHEAQEEIEYQRRSHSKLQSTMESLIEENSSLQKSNGDVRRQKLELHERSAYLEVKLSESQKMNSEFLTEVENLELKISSLQKDIASKERWLISKIDSMFQEHKEQEEKISQARVMLSQIESEKTVEVENLKREIATISLQVNATHDEREQMATDALREVSGLRSDKIRLESSLQDAYSKMKIYEKELQTIKQENDVKIQGLVDSYNALKQSEEMLISDKEHLQRQIEAAKSSEAKCKKTVGELELKLKTSDYEKQHIVEENTIMKVQTERMTHLQDEISTLKGSLEDAKFDREKLEESLQSVSREFEQVKTERDLLTEKISDMQKSLHDGEEDKRSRIALEEKLLRMVGVLTAKEASCAQELELKNEVNRIKRANNEYQKKIQCLEEEIKNKDGSKQHDMEADKTQLEGFQSQDQNNQSEAVEKSVSVTDPAAKVASLEAELKDMKERYLHISLQYAEVEAERGELVMKLKSMSKGKKWFS